MKVGLVTVTYNAANFIDMFMNSLAKQKGISGKLYVIDNLSKDDTLTKLKTYGDRLNDLDIVIMEQSENLGVAEGNNVGMRKAIADGMDVIILVNNDVEFAPDALKIIAESCLELNAAVTPTIFYGDDKTKVWFGGGTLNNWIGLNKHWEFEPSKDSIKISYSPTCCMAFPKSVINDIGYIEPDYFVYFDDTDFCARLNLAQIAIIILRNSKIYHYVSSSTGGSSSPFQIYFGNRNRLLFISRNINGLKKYTSFTYFFLTRFIKFILYFVKYNRNALLAMNIGIKDYFNKKFGVGSYNEIHWIK